MTLCGLEVTAGWLISHAEKCVDAGICKSVMQSTIAIPERFRDRYRTHYIKRAYKFPLYTLLKARTAIRSVLFPGSATVFDWCAIQGGGKMHTKLLAIILSNRNRFSKFFHGTETGRFSSKSAVKWLLGIPLSLLQYLLSANSVRIYNFLYIILFRYTASWRNKRW